MADVTALIDYGAGNLRSVANALRVAGERYGIADPVVVTADPDVVARAARIVLPGVGAFRACAEALRGVPGLVEAMTTRVQTDGAPFLGICVGMQLLATRGIEYGSTPGLDWIGGEVRPIEPADPTIKVPHMGWNDVEPHGGATLVQPGEAYFLHSYHFVADSADHIAAMTDHGGGLVAAVGRDTVLGVQFHPEKSQDYGLEFLTRFLEWNP
ncbi:imidazole glycerol phosphate synthase subunit HisH [Novosphingobium sp.]|uniref:imidazole glycerol phosphate synthase subunit HisH n=1 Tax=Novosphingobium sp. TaxID=1874826 RepID=UPI003B524622